jgi:hypothetical protein
MPGKLVFVINNAQPALVAGSDSEFYVYFDAPDNVRTLRLSLRDNNVTFYKNGQFVSNCGTTMTSDCRDWKLAGPLAAGSGIQPDGSVRLVIDKAQFGINNGDVLRAIQIREDTANNPSRILTTDYAGFRQDYVVVGNDYCARSPVGVVSRKTHGTTAFDVDLLSQLSGVEPRRGGVNGLHNVVFKFAVPVTAQGATVTPASGMTAETDGPPVVSGDGKEVTVKLKNVTNAQTVAVNLLGVSDGTNTADVSVPMGVLLGDTNGDQFVDSGDISQTKSRSGLAVNTSTFRSDVTADGFLDAGDISVVKSKSGTALPQR